MIRVVAVGRIKAPAMRELVDEYATRIRRFAPVELVVVADSNPVEEGRRLLAQARGGPRIACDLAGKQLSSEDFAQLLGTHGGLNFLLGGPEGLSDEVREGCEQKLSFSQFTLPHDLARLVLVEQIYRGLSLLRGHPYHR